MVLIVPLYICGWFFFFFKQKTAYEMRISDWSSDVCSSDLTPGRAVALQQHAALGEGVCHQIVQHQVESNEGRIAVGRGAAQENRRKARIREARQFTLGFELGAAVRRHRIGRGRFVDPIFRSSPVDTERRGEAEPLTAERIGPARESAGRLAIYVHGDRSSTRRHS